MYVSVDSMRCLGSSHYYCFTMLQSIYMVYCVLTHLVVGYKAVGGVDVL